MASLKALVQRVLGITGSVHKIEFAVDDTAEKEVWGFKKDDATEVTPFTDDIKIKSGLAQDTDGMFIPANSSSEYHSIAFGMEKTGSGSSVKETWGYKKDASGNLVPFCDMDLIRKTVQDATIESMYPIGSLFITTASSVPSLLTTKQVDGTSRGWTWTKVANGQALWGCTSGAGGTISAGLPLPTIESGGTHTHKWKGWYAGGNTSGKDCRSRKEISGDNEDSMTRTDGSHSHSIKSDSIYGQSSTVQPPAYKVYVFRRTA